MYIYIQHCSHLTFLCYVKEKMLYLNIKKYQAWQDFYIYRGGREGERRRKPPKASSEPPQASPEPPKGSPDLPQASPKPHQASQSLSKAFPKPHQVLPHASPKLPTASQRLPEFPKASQSLGERHTMLKPKPPKAYQGFSKASQSFPKPKPPKT